SAYGKTIIDGFVKSNTIQNSGLQNQGISTQFLVRKVYRTALKHISLLRSLRRPLRGLLVTTAEDSTANN
ncbi:MAG: hypothetical protein WCV56_08050, partial [Candidatus Omnitrophota bacterium]